MDIKEKINELIEKVTGDEGLLKKFKADPKGTIKDIADDLPDDAIENIVTAIKAKIGDSSAIGDLIDKAKGLFGK